MSGGRKDDAGKLPWALMPWDAVRCIVKVLQFGAKKYAPRNWELGMDWDRPYEALIRHLTSWWEREAADPETGFSHLWHAGCSIMFLIAYELRGVGRDTRPLPLVPAQEPAPAPANNPISCRFDLDPNTVALGSCGVCGAIWGAGAPRPYKCYLRNVSAGEAAAQAAYFGDRSLALLPAGCS